MPYSDKNKAKEYNRQYYKNNWEKLRERHLELKRNRRRKLAEWLKTYKSNLRCMKCSETHPACLDFHHKNKDEKDTTVSIMVSTGNALETIIKEINKCVVLCRNCHAKEHYKMRV